MKPPPPSPDHFDNDAHGQLRPPAEVCFVRLLPGPIERVWAYLTEPDKRATWFAGGAMELRVGGRADFFFHHSNLSPNETPPEKYREVHEPGVAMPEKITRCEPPRVIAFTFGGAEAGPPGEVTIELTPEGDEVRLVLTQRRAANRAELQDVSSGWHAHLAILVARLTGATPPPIWATSARLENEYRALLDATGVQPAPPPDR